MSHCWTLTYTGLSEGIFISRTNRPDNPYGIALGEEWRYDKNKAPAWQQQKVFCLLDRCNPPSFGNRLMEASLITTGEHSYLHRARQSDAGTLVYIDTAHTEPCTTGGFWETLSGSPCTFAKGREDFRISTKRSGNGSRNSIKQKFCYDRGIVLMSYGSRLKIHFHAPGEVVGILEFVNPGCLKFELIEQPC